MSELLRVEKLVKSYAHGQTKIPAVQGASLSIQTGETLGLVGESGCGKTTLGRSILRLYQPDGGRIFFGGQIFYDDTLKKQPKAAPFRRRMQMIFQDPGASLDPRRTVRQIIGQALRVHRLFPGQAERQERIAELLLLVGLVPGQADAYPHQLSGGQQQRVAIARALAAEPDFLVCDEPVSALDLSIQAQILSLLQELQAKAGLSYLFIGHDLSMVRQIAHRIAVMYAGRLVEEAPCEALIGGALHPYTKTLLAAVPTANPAARPKADSGSVQTVGDAYPDGCPFAPRCPLAEAVCRTQTPALRESAPGHFAACHLI